MVYSEFQYYLHGMTPHTLFILFKVHRLSLANVFLLNIFYISKIRANIC
jgi:hypothetical protein